MIKTFKYKTSEYRFDIHDNFLGLYNNGVKCNYKLKGDTQVFQSNLLSAGFKITNNE